MTSQTYLRSVAASLLRLALKVAPQDSFGWGQAVFGELDYVEGDWPALAWAFGGAVVLTKHAMLSLILPGRKRTAINSGTSSWRLRSCLRFRSPLRSERANPKNENRMRPQRNGLPKWRHRYHQISRSVIY